MFSRECFLGVVHELSPFRFGLLICDFGPNRCEFEGSQLWDISKKRTRHGSYKIAEPEKALLDWIYLQRQEGLPVVLDELNLKVTDRTKLLKYASKYPIPVQQTVQPVPWRRSQPS